MTSHDDQETWHKLQKLEAEVYQPQPIKSDSERSEKLQSAFHELMGWFKGLPQIGQAGVVIVAVLTGFSLLNTVVKLISLGISLAVLGVIGYLGYRLFIAPSSNQNTPE